ncbi:MAG: hypothetical protein GX567_03680 [Clostridia bacterium]|nr:hypothetical protein [Clostridia bacterium]
MSQTNCDSCNNYVYDEDEEAYFCECNLDEDEYARLMQDVHYECPFYQSNDEYQIVRKQI